jgi:cbb3-type cytochrome oxidase subunit 1
MAMTPLAAAATPTPTPAVASGLSSSRAAPLDLPLRFMLTGLAFAVIALGAAAVEAPAFLAGTFLAPPLPLLVHLTALGWLTMVAMGALYQFVPVVLDVPIFSHRLGRAQFYVYLAGVLGLTSAMAAGRMQDAPVGAALLVAGIGLFLYNMVRTLAQVRRWPLTGWFIVAALTYLGLVVSAGFTLALNIRLGFLPVSQVAFVEAHAHLGALGWLSLLLIGVSYKLTPMFALTHPFDEWRLGKPVFILLNLALPALFASLLLRLGVVALACCAAVLGVAVALYAWDFATMLRRRRRKPIDLTQHHNIAAVVCLCLTLCLGLALVASPAGTPFHTRLAMGYAVTALAGWLGLATIGQLYKILPFLVWTQRYAPKMGKERVPLLKNMYALRPAQAGFILLVVGLPVAVVCILAGWLPGIQTGFTLLLAGSLIAAANLFRVVFR